MMSIKWLLAIKNNCTTSKNSMEESSVNKNNGILGKRFSRSQMFDYDKIHPIRTGGLQDFNLACFFSI